MPRTRQLETYPNPAFWALFDRVLSTQLPVTVPCTRTQALSMRGEIYAWRRAAEAAPEQAAQLGITASRLREVALQISHEGLVAVLSSSLATASLISDALGGVPKMTNASTQALERLKALGLAPEGGPTS